jgi:hypothetical protein
MLLISTNMHSGPPRPGLAATGGTVTMAAVVPAPAVLVPVSGGGGNTCPVEGPSTWPMRHVRACGPVGVDTVSDRDLANECVVAQGVA